MGEVVAGRLDFFAGCFNDWIDTGDDGGVGDLSKGIWDELCEWGCCEVELLGGDFA